jgi:hypothetical protein
MLCSVVLVRKGGAPVPRWQLGSLPAHLGDLVVRDEHQPDLGRNSRVAELLNRPDGGSPLRLFDVNLIGTQSSWLALSGFEREDLGGRYADHAQTWHVTPVLKAVP